MAIGNIPGILLLAGATALLILASISTPVVHNFYYLKAHFDGVSFAGSNAGASNLFFGLWGACINTPSGRSCTKESLGYGLNLSILNLNDDTRLQQTLLRGTAKALVLVPVSAGVSFIALIFALSTNIFLDVIASFIALLAAFVTFIAFVLASVVFITARHRINRLDGVSASLQNCYWFLLAALIADLLASCFVLFGCVKRRRAHRSTRTAPVAGDGVVAGTAAPYAGRRRWWGGRRTAAPVNGTTPVMAEKRHWWGPRNRTTAAVV